MKNEIIKVTRDHLEKSALMYYISNLNIKFDKETEMWISRYMYFLNRMLKDKETADGIDLETLLNYIKNNKESSIKDYLCCLFDSDLKKKVKIKNEIMEYHNKIINMYKNTENFHNSNLNNGNNYKLAFKEEDCFTLFNDDYHVHIKATGSSLLNFNWTVLCIEYDNKFYKKNIKLKSSTHIKYYLTLCKKLETVDEHKLQQEIEKKATA